MASNVVVIDSTARRTTVKTTPGTHLSEVLEEACRKLGYKSDHFGLKHNNKQVDLSRTYRLSGLVSGAKLELVQLSKSIGAVTVALQLPPSEEQGVANARLTDKFPSNTTLWLLLRKFEAGVAGGPASGRNFTARGVPSSGAGAGRLFYEQPVIHALQRELSTFTGLQKTLAQLGFNSGSTLLRLSFRQTEQPLEDALQETQAYFDSLDGPQVAQPPSTQQVAPTTSTPTQEQPTATAPIDGPSEQTEQDTVMTESEPEPKETSTQPPPPTSDTTATPQPTEPTESLPSPTSRPVSVFRPPTGTVPSATQQSYNDSDFTPTVEHAQAHQKMLNEASRNRRLKTDAELAVAAKEEADRLAAVKEVEIKIRFPDQSSLGTKFKQADTGSMLYTFVREECLDAPLRNEVFVLGVPGGAGRGGMEVIPDNQKRLIQDLHLRGRVLLVFVWDEKKASATAKGIKNVLRAELRERAQDVKAPQQVVPTEPEEKGTKVNVGGADGKDDDGGEGSKGGLGKKMPKWLKGLSKK